MTDIEIGRAKRARRAYSFDDVAVVPSRRTRDTDCVSLAWTIDASKFEIPVLAAPMDSVVSPKTAIEIGRLGGSASTPAKIDAARQNGLKGGRPKTTYTCPCCKASLSIEGRALVKAAKQKATTKDAAV